MVYLKEYRSLARLTQRQVAQQLGIQPPAVYKWEQNITSPTLRDAERLAEIFGISTGQLFVDPSDQFGRPAGEAFSEIRAKFVGISDAAWEYVGKNVERIEEAAEVDRLLKVYGALSKPYRAHWLAIAELSLPKPISGQQS